MTPRDALAAGDLTAALALQRPLALDAPSQLVLAELLGVDGDYDAARRVVKRIDSPDADWPAARRGFLATLRAAARRRADRRTRLLGPDAPHLRHRRRAYRLHAADPARAARHADRSDALAPELAGHADGFEFRGLRDADDRFGSALELLVAGRWDWVAWASVARLELAAPTGPLDGAFRPAVLTLHDGRAFGVALPLIYPHAGDVDDGFKLGLETDFAAETDGPIRGVGARLLYLGESEVPLSSVRRLDLRPVG